MSKNLISFFFEDVKHNIDKSKISTWLTKTVKNENKKLINVNYIFCSDKFLYDINVKSLNHDTLTDVITFYFGQDNDIEGEIYISLDRVKDNAKIFGKDLDDELLRVIVHGMLHLCGYNDKTPKEEVNMRQKEDFYLDLYQKL